MGTCEIMEGGWDSLEGVEQMGGLKSAGTQPYECCDIIVLVLDLVGVLASDCILYRLCTVVVYR